MKMNGFFIKLLNMSITATWLILAVLLLRILLKKSPKWLICALWALVAVRLICPFSIQALFSLIPSRETIPSGVIHYSVPTINSGVQPLDHAFDAFVQEVYKANSVEWGNPLSEWLPIAVIIWLSGGLLLLIYALISWVRIKVLVSASVPIRDNIRICDDIHSPFILGWIHPVVYVPSSLSGRDLELALLHENAHLQRHDHWWKPMGFLLLMIHWFNPFCWVAFILLSRDIEMACDEKVIRNMQQEDIAAYSQALLDCSISRKRISACPLAFGEAGVKTRIRGILNYKKPTFWILSLSIVACMIFAVCLMTDPQTPDRELSAKLRASMDLAVRKHNYNYYNDGYFPTAAYDVFGVERSDDTTCVYTWLLYEEYSFDGTDVREECSGSFPVAITFHTPHNDSDLSTYEVIDYWEPEDGNYYDRSIMGRFPKKYWNEALAFRDVNDLYKLCLATAREHFSASQKTENSYSDSEAWVSEQYGSIYQYFLDSALSSKGSPIIYIWQSSSGEYICSIFRDMNSSFYPLDPEKTNPSDIDLYISVDEAKNILSEAHLTEKDVVICPLLSRYDADIDDEEYTLYSEHVHDLLFGPSNEYYERPPYN